MSRQSDDAVADPQNDPVAYFDDFASGYASWTGKASPNFRERLLLFEALIRDCRRTSPAPLCLDLGCGNGELTFLARRLGYRAIGLDGSHNMLRVAAQEQQLAEQTVTFRCERLPLTDGFVDDFRRSADLIIMSSVIEYIDDDVRCLTQCASMLSPNGRALISFPNAASLWRWLERSLGARGPFRGTIIEVQRRQYRLHDITTLADTAGLTVERVRYFGLPYPHLLGRLLGSRRPRWLSTLVLVEFRCQPS